MSTPPEPRLKGRFNLFDTPGGGLHIAFQVDPTDENPDPPIEHIDVPPGIINAAKMLGEGKITPGKAIGILMSMGKP